MVMESESYADNSEDSGEDSVSVNIVKCVLQMSIEYPCIKFAATLKTSLASRLFYTYEQTCMERGNEYICQKGMQ